jgi:hypothetical protein
MMGQMEEKRKRNVAGKVNVTINWKAVLSRFDNTSRHQLPEKLVKEVLLSGNADISKMTAFADSSSKSAYIQTAIIALMSTPEYQLM